MAAATGDETAADRAAAAAAGDAGQGQGLGGTARGLAWVAAGLASLCTGLRFRMGAGSNAFTAAQEAAGVLGRHSKGVVGVTAAAAAVAGLWVCSSAGVAGAWAGVDLPTSCPQARTMAGGGAPVMGGSASKCADILVRCLGAVMFVGAGAGAGGGTGA